MVFSALFPFLNEVFPSIKMDSLKKISKGEENFLIKERGNIL